MFVYCLYVLRKTEAPLEQGVTGVFPVPTTVSGTQYVLGKYLLKEWMNHSKCKKCKLNLQDTSFFNVGDWQKQKKNW